MGVYPIHCPECEVLFNWFSGRPLDQRCPDCLAKADKLNPYIPDGKQAMTPDQQVIDALKIALNAKDDLIAHLKAEIERLKALPTITIGPQGTQPNLNVPYVGPPITGPLIAPQWPLPQQPWYGDPLHSPGMVIISDGSGSSTAEMPHKPNSSGTTIDNLSGNITGSSLPFGSVQSYPSVQSIDLIKAAMS